MAQLKYRFLCYAVGIGMLCIPQSSFADAAPPGSISDSTEECAKELLLSYYPPDFVTESLKKYNIPKDKWDEIIEGLKQKDKEVIRIVEEKAANMDPNPLKDPQQRQQAIKIFKDTLLEVFASVVRPAGITDDKTIQGLLDDIQQQKAKRFAQCIEKRKVQLPPPALTPKTPASPKVNPTAPSATPAPQNDIDS